MSNRGASKHQKTSGSPVSTAPASSSTTIELIDVPAWERFAHSVAAALVKLAKDECLILSETKHHRFVQFLDLGSEGMRAEAVSNDYLQKADQLSRAAIDILLAIGWDSPTHSADTEDGAERPSSGSPNFHMHLGHPLPIAAIAVSAVQTLTYAFGARSLSELRYRAFNTKNTADRVDFPALGIRADEA